MREFNNKLEVTDQELALRREAASFNKGAAANRPRRSVFDPLDFMMTLFQMLLVASRSLSLVR